MFIRLAQFCVIFLSLLIAASGLHGQATAPTLRGQITDPSGAAIPDGTITATSDTGKVSVAQTDKSGNFTMLLPTGTYVIRGLAKGFAPFEKSGIKIEGTAPVMIAAQLKIESEAQEVTVSDQVQVSTDPTSNVGQLVLRGTDLETLPDDPDDLAADLQALAGPAAGPNGGQIFIDGFSGGKLPPKSSIREIRINSNPFAAEYDRLGFGRIEILTKPGTDKFHGQGFFNFGDKDLNTRNPFLSEQPPFRSELFGGNVSGAINKKTSFFLDVERRSIDENALVVAQVLDSNFNIVPFNSGIVTPIRDTTVSPRIDYALNANNTLTGRYSYSDRSSGNQGVGQFNLSSRAIQMDSQEQTLQLTETSILNPTTINETRFMYDRMNTTQHGNSTSPAINVQDAFTGGGASLNLNFNHQGSYEFTNNTSLTRGTHSIKLGGRIRAYRLDNQSTSNYNGTFTFFSIATYAAAQKMLAQGATAAQIYAAGDGPGIFSITGGTPLAGVSQVDAGLFIQDDWRFKPNLTLSAGLRMETQNNISDHADFGPRFSLAWGIDSKKGGPAKTVLRLGGGLFYDRFDYNLTLNALRLNGTTQQQFVVENPSFYPNVPSVSSLTASLVPEARYKVDSHLHTPYVAQEVVGLERQLPHNITAAVNFINSEGVHVLRTRDINAPLPGTYSPLIPGSGVRPYGTAAGDIYLYESSGIFKQRQIISNISARVNTKLTMFGFYAYGHANSNTDGASTFPANQYDLSSEYSRASFDVHHRAFIGGNITAKWGVSFSPFVMLSSGPPFNITVGRDIYGDGIVTARPAFATSSSLPANVRATPWGTFDLSPTAGEQLIPRNYGDGPGNVSLNLRISRTWSFGKRAEQATPTQGGPPRGGMMMGGGPPPGGGGGGGPRGGGPGGPGGMFGAQGSGKYNLTASISGRNIINHVNLAAPDGNLSSPLFGQSTSLASGFGPFAAGAAGNRKIEAQLRFSF
ncbi:MAG TPA: carboxypeptidase regulatory-like domain-containing protein [Bryobacteraceae bacterium]